VPGKPTYYKPREVLKSSTPATKNSTNLLVSMLYDLKNARIELIYPKKTQLELFTAQPICEVAK